VTRPDPDDDALVLAALEDLARLSFAEHSLDSLLHRVTDAAERILPGRRVASITVFRQGRFLTVAASDPLATDLDAVQYRDGAGPCVAATTTGRPVDLPDVRHDRRWAGFAAAALERGVRSVFSHPLPARTRVLGGLNLYADVPQVADERTQRLVARVAGHAVVPVSNMYLYRSAVERAEHLEVALDSRGVIDQAKGILMERFKVTADQAFQALARLSMETNVRVREVAERLVRTGEFPEP
jgi:GAF domain-containing protein